MHGTTVKKKNQKITSAVGVFPCQRVPELRSVGHVTKSNPHGNRTSFFSWIQFSIWGMPRASTGQLLNHTSDLRQNTPNTTTWTHVRAGHVTHTHTHTYKIKAISKNVNWFYRTAYLSVLHHEIQKWTRILTLFHAHFKTMRLKQLIFLLPQKFSHTSWCSKRSELKYAKHDTQARRSYGNAALRGTTPEFHRRKTPVLLRLILLLKPFSSPEVVIFFNDTYLV